MNFSSWPTIIISAAAYTPFICICVSLSCEKLTEAQNNVLPYIYFETTELRSSKLILSCGKYGEVTRDIV